MHEVLLKSWPLTQVHVMVALGTLGMSHMGAMLFIKHGFPRSSIQHFTIRKSW